MAVAERIIAHVRHHHPDLPILAHSVSGRDDSLLSSVDAEVFPEGLEMTRAFAGQLLFLLGIPGRLVEARLNAISAEDSAPLEYFFMTCLNPMIRRVTIPNRCVLSLSMRTAMQSGEHLLKNTLNDCGLQIRAVRSGLLRLPVRNLRHRLKAGEVFVLQGEPETIDRAIARLIDAKTAFTAADG